MNNFFDKIDELTRKRPTYSEEEIELAQKKAKKSGKTFLEVLQETTGKSLDSLEPSKKNLAEAEELTKATNQMLNDLIQKNNADILCETTQKDLKDLQMHLKEDFGSPAPAKTPVEAPVDVDSFDGIIETVSQDVFGQDAFLKKLVVAFKRPFILPEEENHARNCFYLCGPKDSGKHYALAKLTKELRKRKILKNDSVYEIDLSRYPMAGKDNVFLQDLYAALSADSQVILFENYDACHISYLNYISDLVTKGECYLQDRYMLQKGQLINAGNAFTKETVSTFTAKGKYLVFLGPKSVDSLANVFGAPFINALGDICTSLPLTEESYLKIAKVQWDLLIEKTKNQLSFLLSADEEKILQTSLTASSKNAGVEGILTFFDQLLKSLATLKLEGSYQKDTQVTLKIKDQSLLAKIAGEEIDLMNNLPKAYAGDLAAVKEELHAIVGLSEVKKYILSLEEYYETQKRRREAGLKASDVSKHMIFTGNPGTGKTTIARIISRYLKAIGILSGGQLVEVSRADLVGRFVGHTAPLVNQVINSALGGVLFIDEAYSLYRGKEDSFGIEAIDTLVKGIEDNRDNLIVILAGYSKEMESFLEANSGLKSRFPNIIDFRDYTGEELLAITKITVKSKGYTLNEEVEAPLLAYYTLVQESHPDTAGNGRLVRNKVEEAILNQSRRLVAEPEADLSMLMACDFVLDE